MNKALELEAIQTVGAFYQARVMNADGTPATDWTDPQHNLILPSGFFNPNTDYNWLGHIGKAYAGTGTTPNKVLLDGTFQQSGTTVTRASGTGVFSSGNVNDFIKFGSGERAKITSFTNTLTVEVDRTQTVSASSLTVYDTSRTALDAQVSTTTTLHTTGNGWTNATDTGKVTYYRTFNFPTESTARTYTEVACGQNGGTALISRLVLDSPVAVGIGQYLQLRIDFVITLSAFRTSASATVSITGWPRPYSISSITPGAASGTAFDILLTEDCSSHYVAGRQITINGALPPTTGISSISSTGSDFTVTTAAAHGKSPGDSIVIAGATPSGYNGTWTCAAGTTGSTIVVTSGINPGAGSGGTVRLETPTTWYNGTWTIASFPNASTIRVTDNTVTVAAGAAGTVTNSIAASGIVTGLAAFFFHATTENIVQHGVCDMSNSSSIENKRCLMFTEANLKTGLQYGVTPSLSSSLADVICSVGSYDTANRKRLFIGTFPPGTGTSQSIRQIVLKANSSYFFITFDERQRKDALYSLAVNFTASWEPDLN